MLVNFEDLYKLKSALVIPALNQRQQIKDRLFSTMVPLRGASALAVVQC
jgi:hypothetical protein